MVRLYSPRRIVVYNRFYFTVIVRISQYQTIIATCTDIILVIDNVSENYAILAIASHHSIYTGDVANDPAGVCISLHILTYSNSAW